MQFVNIPDALFVCPELKQQIPPVQFVNVPDADIIPKQ
jgi:hypothetical protein